MQRWVFGMTNSVASDGVILEGLKYVLSSYFRVMTLCSIHET